jgi:hypothetical protein
MTFQHRATKLATEDKHMNHETQISMKPSTGNISGICSTLPHKVRTLYTALIFNGRSAPIGAAMSVVEMDEVHRFVNAGI